VLCEVRAIASRAQLQDAFDFIGGFFPERFTHEDPRFDDLNLAIPTISN
jgi:hypothetical protein